MSKTPKIKLVRLRGRNQITLPASVIEALSLKEDDYLAVVLGEEGIVRLRPAKMVTEGTQEAERAMQRAEADLKAGRSAQFDTVKEFSTEMLASHREQMEEMEADRAEADRAELRGTLAKGQGYGVRARTMMLVHVGTVSTSASIQRDRVPIFTRNIELGSETATAQQLAEEVRKTLEFFQATIPPRRGDWRKRYGKRWNSFEGPSVGMVFLSVGPPPMMGLASELKRALGLQVRELSAAEEAAPLATPMAGSLEADFLSRINVGIFEK